MKTAGLLAAVAVLGCVGLGATAASAEYSEEKVNCAFNAPHKCSRDLANKGPYTFNFVLHDLSAYTVEKVWLRARYSRASGAGGSEPFSDVGVFDKNFSEGSAVVFSFDAQRLANKLGPPTGKSGPGGDPVKAGVEVRIEIQSRGAGGGRRDSCQSADLKYIDSQKSWAWRLHGASTWKLTGPDTFAFFYAGGTVNAVKCRFDEFEGAKVAG